MNVGPVLDGATAFDVCKQSDCKYAKSVSVLESPVLFSTVSADGSASKTAHIETPLVDIPESIVVPTAHDSLVSHATVHKAGWDIVYTSGKCALVKGEEVHGAVPDKGMFRLPMLDDAAKSDEQVMSALGKARKYWMRVEFERVKRHLRRAHRP
jgi:hypothetical protein